MKPNQYAWRRSSIQWHRDIEPKVIVSTLLSCLSCVGVCSSMSTQRRLNCRVLWLTLRSVGYHSTFRPAHWQAQWVALCVRVRKLRVKGTEASSFECLRRLCSRGGDAVMVNATSVWRVGFLRGVVPVGLAHHRRRGVDPNPQSHHHRGAG